MSFTFKDDRGPLARMESPAETVWTGELAETVWTAKTGWTVRPENQDPKGPKDQRGHLDPRDHPGRLVRTQSRPPSSPHQQGLSRP